MWMSGESVPVRGNSTYKDPEARADLVWSWNREEATVAGPEGVMGTVVAKENREEATRGLVIWGLVGYSQSFSFNCKCDGGAK